jgi:hypothetical protein
MTPACCHCGRGLPKDSKVERQQELVFIWCAHCGYLTLFTLRSAHVKKKRKGGTFMMTVRDWLRWKFPTVFGKPAPDLPPPEIMTEWGPTTEWARKQSAINMRLDAECKKRVENLLIREMGSVEAGLDESRRRYPEAYVE